jgi:hypothetical protein
MERSPGAISSPEVVALEAVALPGAASTAVTAKRIASAAPKDRGRIATRGDAGRWEDSNRSFTPPPLPGRPACRFPRAVIIGPERIAGKVLLTPSDRQTWGVAGRRDDI